MNNLQNATKCGKTLHHMDLHSEECHDECPFPCRTSSISYQIENLKLENRNDSFQLLIDFDDYKYMLVNQIPKTKITDLAAKLGGILGLFVGLKFLSLIEIIEFILGFMISVRRKV